MKFGADAVGLGDWVDLVVRGQGVSQTDPHPASAPHYGDADRVVALDSLSRS